MLYGYGLLSMLTLCLMVYCALNVITTPDGDVRNLPKMIWLLLVLFFPLVGGVAWLVAGRPVTPSRSLPYKGNAGIPAEYDRPVARRPARPTTTPRSCASSVSVPRPSARRPPGSAAPSSRPRSSGGRRSGRRGETGSTTAPPEPARRRLASGATTVDACSSAVVCSRS